MSASLSKEQESLRGRDVRTMSAEQLVLWINACEKMLSWVPHKNGRKGWKDSKALAEAVLEKRKMKASTVSGGASAQRNRVASPAKG